MKVTGALRDSGGLFRGIVLIVFICMEAAAHLLNSCSGACEPGPVEVALSCPAENSFHRIDMTNPAPSFLQEWTVHNR